MAEPLKNMYGPDIPRKIASMIKGVHAQFDDKAFVRDALKGYDALELLARGWHMAHTLHKHLPSNYAKAIEVLVASLGDKILSSESKPASDGNMMTSFLYLPHTCFVAKYGLDDFEASMHAQYEITQRFTCEYSIRPFLEQHTERTLVQLRKWTRDKSEHVRRLVSEGTRPRLPWASRLRVFDNNPKPVLELLDALKDDSSLYVRRSVANHMNDIGKDNPALLVSTMKAWSVGASPERTWLVRHALRSAVKRADKGALEVLGFGKRANVTVDGISITPRRPRIGESVVIAFDVTNNTSATQHLLIDFTIHFVKANGSSSPKVFKLKELDLSGKASIRLTKKVSLAVQTTRMPYAGKHNVDVVINGAAQPLGTFTLLSR